MDHEFDQKPDNSQNKHEQANASFEELQKLMGQFKITSDIQTTEHTFQQAETAQEDAELSQHAPALSVDDLIDRAVSEEEPLTKPAEKPEESKKTETASVVKPETLTQAEKQGVEIFKADDLDVLTEQAEQHDADAEPKAEKQPVASKTTAAKKVIHKKEFKPELTQEEREQQEREAILEGSAKRRHPEQTTATVTINHVKPSAKNTTPVKKKHNKNSKDAVARRRKKRLMRLGTVIVLLLVAIVLVVSAIKSWTNHSSEKQPPAAGSAALTEEEKMEQRQEEGPASERETKQYLAIKDDDTLPSYAKKYPGLYADAVDEPNTLSDEKVCYLTFDDGPSDTNTPKILDILKKENVKATFFVVTSEIDEKEQAILQRILDEGHTLCIHANEHRYSELYASTEAYLDDFAKAYDKIYELTGYRVQGFRFPGGSNGQVNTQGCYDDIVTEMTRRGFEYYDWNAYAHDAENGGYTPAEMAEKALHEIDICSRNDVMLLMHDTYGKEKTVDALQQIITQLKARGIKMLPITNETRPVHFEVSDATPQEYDEYAEEQNDSSDETVDASETAEDTTE